MHGRFDPFIQLLPFALECARAHVVKHETLGGLDPEETEDNVQYLVQCVIEQWPRYAADRASRQGFIVQIISTRVLSLIRKDHALCRTPLREGQLQDWEDDPHLVSKALNDIDHVDKRLDMASAIGLLSESEVIFIRLVAERGLVFAAKCLGMTRAKARGLQARIRTKLVEAGIGNPRWKSPRPDTNA